MLGSCAAALSLGRLKFGLPTDILHCLSDYVATDQDAGLAFLTLAALRGSVAGACLAAQINELKKGLFLSRIPHSSFLCVK